MDAECYEADQVIMLLDHEIIQLLDQLQRYLQRPTFSYRLEDMRTMVVQLVACWATYRRERENLEACADASRLEVRSSIAGAVEGGVTAAIVDNTPDDRVELACQAQVPAVHSPRPCGFATSPNATDLRYTSQELKTLFCVARQEDVEWGGRYDARRAAINLWTEPWARGCLSALTGESTLMGTWYFQWGTTPRLWQISTDVGWTLTDLLQELGGLELKALWRLKHGAMPRSESLPP
jgi:hypothetical protein